MIPLPDPTTARFDELLEEARSRIPAHAPDWTDHNPSDPGMTLVELFAHLTELLSYRLNQVGDESLRAWIRLLGGRAGTDDGAAKERVDETVRRLRRRERAVTPSDFEALAVEAHGGANRAISVPGTDLESGRPDVGAGHISLVVVTGADEGPPAATGDPEILEAVREHLEPRRLLGTRLHVLPPRYVAFGVRVSIVAESDAGPDGVRTRVEEALRRFFHPLHGGRSGEGWSLGADVAVSEVYRVLDSVAGVDFAQGRTDPDTGARLDELTVEPDERGRLVHNDQGRIVALTLREGELPRLRVEPGDVQVRASASSPPDRSVGPEP